MEMKQLRIGVVGYCPPTKFDEQKADEYLSKAYDRLEKQFPHHKKVVVSGLTNVGVLKLGYEQAKKRGWKTVGIACSKAKNYELFPVDEKIIVGNEWGDESQTFIRSIDVLVRIGGGKQSLKETAEVKKNGKEIIEYELPTL